MYGVTITSVGMPKVKAKEARQAKQSGYLAGGEHRHDEYTHIHFTPRGARRYNYAPRKTKFVRLGKARVNRRGRPMAPSGDPLTWTSRSRGLSRIVKFRANSKGVKITWPINAFNFRPGGIDLRDEFTRDIPRERRGVENAIKRETEKRINNSRTRVVVKL